MFEPLHDQTDVFSRFVKSKRFKIVAAMTVIWLIVIAAIGALLATPYYSLSRMRNAAVNRDAETFCSYIDFPLLRENLKAELNAKMLFEMNKDEKLKDNPFAGLAALAGPALVNNMVDGYVTPAAIERSFKQASLNPKDRNVATETLNRDFLSEERGQVETAYKDFSEFQILYQGNDRKRAILIFQRRALINWQLVNIKFE